MEEQKKVIWGDFEPLCIVRFVLRHIGLVLLTALTGAMLATLLLTLAVPPTYTSNTTFAVTSRSAVSSVSTVAATNAVATQFGELLKSSLVQTDAAKRLDLAAFPASVSTDVPKDTNIIKMSVTADSPEAAYKSSLAIIDAHKTYSGAIFASALLDTINGPSIATAADSRGLRSKVLLLSAPLCAVAMIVLLVLFALNADTIQTVNGAKHQIDGRLLTTIRHERRQRSLSAKLRRKKTALLISDPTCSFYYTETIHQLRVRIEQDKEKNGHKVFLVTSCGENEGKSTAAANLALSLAQKHRRVLLIDADLRKPAQALIFDTAAVRGKSLDALLMGRESDPKVCTTAVRGKLNVLLTQPLSRRHIEALNSASFRSVIDSLRDAYSYIIVDTPPLGLFADAEVIADAVDASLLIVRQDSATAMAVNDAIDTLSETHSAVLGYVLNNFRSLQTAALYAGRYSYGYGYHYGYGYGYSYGKSGRKAAKKEDTANG